MSDEDSPSEPESTIYPPYAFRFRQHLADVQAHLAGLDGEDLLPSYIPPTGYWTSSEKNVFFHSLGVYSRFRPDLVAACIGTKTVLDVCAYINALDNALYQDRHLLRPRSDLMGAMEVSTAWVRREERMAEELSFLEPEWEERIMLLQREEEISARNTLTSSAAPEEELAFDDETWAHDRRRHWRQEDALSQLDCHHLRVMEGMLKEEESGKLDGEDTLPEDQQLAGPVPLPSQPLDIQSSDRTPHSSFVDVGMIDPILLRLPGLPVPEQPSQNDLSHQQRVEPLPHVEKPHDPCSPCNTASSPPSSPGPVLPQPSPHARSPSPEGDKETAIDPSDLSPASRRRFQKRLYMRRKRAAQRGEEASAVVAKLRPGRKVKDRKTRKPRGKAHTTEPEPSQLDDAEGADALMDVDQNILAPSSSAPAKDVLQDEANDDDYGDGYASDAPRPRRRNNSGMTKPYKIKKEFAFNGIDADTLIDKNLGFFHLSTLSRLMTLYKSGYDIKSSDAVMAISADTIRLLTAILVEFTTEVVQRTCVSREQENYMKGGIKVYRHLRNEISVRNVNHVLEIMGMRGLTKKQYFAQLLGEDMPETPEVDEDGELPTGDGNAPENEDEVDDGGDGEDNTEEEDEDDDGGGIYPPEEPRFPDLLPLHRECHPPLVHLPNSLVPHALAGPGATAITDELLMPVDTDEDELLGELEEEMELDETDQTVARTYEENLWKQYGKETGNG
ncbi:hypothetical protein D9615_002572 [Tricholomella constricta]|uniref:Uncharacterized protein n=1 Tax=Tricholomella constricta TaxID=117010 RepID=A0A8H5M922_9AGAR|nr:hypothetical protein D9615_002572 [Tricholomella constricta]